jgi:hypothetical protein
VVAGHFFGLLLENSNGVSRTALYQRAQPLYQRTQRYISGQTHYIGAHPIHDIIMTSFYFHQIFILLRYTQFRMVSWGRNLWHQWQF